MIHSHLHYIQYCAVKSSKLHVGNVYLCKSAYSCICVQYAYLHVMITHACVLYLQMLHVYLDVHACTHMYC